MTLAWRVCPIGAGCVHPPFWRKCHGLLKFYLTIDKEWHWRCSHSTLYKRCKEIGRAAGGNFKNKREGNGHAQNHCCLQHRRTLVSSTVSVHAGLLCMRTETMCLKPSAVTTCEVSILKPKNGQLPLGTSADTRDLSPYAAMRTFKCPLYWAITIHTQVTTNIREGSACTLAQPT